MKRSDFTEEGVIVVPKKAINQEVDIDIDSFVYTSSEIYQSNSSNHVSGEYLITTLRNLNPNGATLGLICRHQIEQEMMLAQGMYAFKVTDIVDKDYMCFISRTPSFRRAIKKITVGSTQVHIRSREFKEIEITLPPLDEQKRVSKMLNRIISSKKNINAINTHYDTLFSTLIQDLP